MDQKPKRICCERCGSTKLKPLMHKTYVDCIIVPLWHCTKCTRNIGSEVVKEVDKHNWQAYPSYENLVNEVLK